MPFVALVGFDNKLDAARLQPDFYFSKLFLAQQAAEVGNRN